VDVLFSNIDREIGFPQIWHFDSILSAKTQIFDKIWCIHPAQSIVWDDGIAAITAAK
jgi:hypothetical protein